MNKILGLCDGLDETTFEAGRVLLAEGTRTGALYILIEGTVEIVKGDFQIDVVSEPGAFFGEVSALLDIPHMATVRTLSRSRLYRIEHAVQFLNNYPMIALEVARLLAQRLNGVTNYLVNLKDRFGDQKALEIMIHQQRSRFIAGPDRDPSI
jgi:CRP/FNR family cyclic AMP-dependent transcriptional regulator